MKQQQILWMAYLKEKDNAAGLALADYLEELKIDLPLAIGLKFCIKYKKFPKLDNVISYFQVYYVWYSSDDTMYNALKNKKINATLPYMFFCIDINSKRYNNIKNAIRAIGKILIDFKKISEDII